MASTEAGGDAVAVAILNEVPSVQGAGMERDFFQDDELGSTCNPDIREESQIFIRACNRTVALNVNLQCDSVEDVKRAIEKREGIPVEEQHLVVCGKPLREGAFLRDYRYRTWLQALDKGRYTLGKAFYTWQRALEGDPPEAGCQ
ncbi:uncharacterized protein [Miscanthus floridulus]|uniref:uncharacterized protein n=1 Tax=Miscanthus floridulus TaxID=154761 RepID=UPI00345848A3